MWGGALTVEREYAGFDSLLEPEPAWHVGSFPTRNGLRELREPDAVPIIQNRRLRMGVRRFTRRHDRVQILDNAKHVLFSTAVFDVPRDGISFTLEMGAEGIDCIAGDLYDGFASFLCLDLTTGTAIDVFCRDRLCAAVFARLPFPGIEVADLQPMKYWAIFDEKELAGPGLHEYTIAIEPETITWTVDGDSIRSRRMPDYALGAIVMGLGLMTEKDIGPDGSTSVHGQGVRGEWGPIRIDTP